MNLLSSDECSTLKESFNELGQRYLSRNGRLLCSPRNPILEARDWVSRQKLTSEDQRVLVLGIGCGYHIVELSQQFPRLKIDFVDFDEQIKFEMPIGQRLTSDDLISRNFVADHDAILPFRPSWANFDKEYVKLYLKLTGRDQTLIQLKNENQKIWDCLIELVK